MPKIDISAVPIRTGSSYPEAFRHIVAGREWRPLAAAAGLTQFGANLVRIAPGGASSARHWHEEEDEFVYVLEGELILVEDDGAKVMRSGDAAAFKAGVPNGHHLVNRTERDAVFLVVGSCAAQERAHYSDIDLAYARKDGRFRFTSKAGEPYGDKPGG